MSESDDLERRIQELEIENRRLTTTVSHLERSYDITLQTLGDALDLKNAETEGHSKRVTAFTIAMAKHMGLNDKEIRVIARGAFLHDIGKMAIPDAIMRKPGKAHGRRNRHHAGALSSWLPDD
jgi:putative nucleotidyltransferase with HDIG domain